VSLNLLVYSEHHLLLRLLSLQLCNEHLSLLIKNNNNKKKHDLSSKGFLIVEYMGKREQLPVNTKGSQVSPRLAEVVVKQLDPRWARQGATAALLKAAGYSTDVAVKTEYAGDLPAHLSCWSSHFLLFYYFFWVGELFITHTWTCNERNHKCQMEGHPQPKPQATLTTWVEADTKVYKEATCQAKQAAHKAVVHQPTAKPVHFQQTKHHLCLNLPNIAVKITSAYDVHCKPKGLSSHHNLNQWIKHTRESTVHIKACHRACQTSS
jgi:hypothetical protein